MKKQEILDNLRYQIFTLDKELIYLFFRRFEMVKQIGEIKKELGLKALDEERWKTLLNSNLHLAGEYSLSKDFVEDIWKVIHNYSLEMQK